MKERLEKHKITKGGIIKYIITIPFVLACALLLSKCVQTAESELIEAGIYLSFYFG